jgi:hypothetical protein
VLDKDRVINWWIGRLADPDLAEWSGLPVRVVRMILESPRIRAGVAGGGRGRWATRRLSYQARNAVPAVGAMVEAGLSLELASNIVFAAPYFLSEVNEIIDYKDLTRGLRGLILCDPAGGWLPTDMVPWHVWERYVRPCRDLLQKNPGPGDVFFLEAGYYEQHADERGILHIGRSDVGLPDVDVIPLTTAPIYAGEIDPIGFYHPNTDRPEAVPQFDDHILVVNGRWVFHRCPDPRPVDALHQSLTGKGVSERGFKIIDDPIGVIEDDKKTVRPINRGSPDAETAMYYLANYSSLLDVNMTLAVRRMKRRALGLPVRETD